MKNHRHATLWHVEQHRICNSSMKEKGPHYGHQHIKGIKTLDIYIVYLPTWILHLSKTFNGQNILNPNTSFLSSLCHPSMMLSEVVKFLMLTSSKSAKKARSLSSSSHVSTRLTLNSHRTRRRSLRSTTTSSSLSPASPPSPASSLATCDPGHRSPLADLLFNSTIKLRSSLFPNCQIPPLHIECDIVVHMQVLSGSSLKKGRGFCNYFGKTIPE